MSLFTSAGKEVDWTASTEAEGWSKKNGSETRKESTECERKKGSWASNTEHCSENSLLQRVFSFDAQTFFHSHTVCVSVFICCILQSFKVILLTSLLKFMGFSDKESGGYVKQKYFLFSTPFFPIAFRLIRCYCFWLQTVTAVSQFKWANRRRRESIKRW